MIPNPLFFKKKQIDGANIELTFHGDLSGEYPVVTYLLTDCKDIEALDWGLLNPYDDEVIIAYNNTGDGYVFQITDAGGRMFEVNCGEIEEESRAYNAEELKDLLIDVERKMVRVETAAKRMQTKLDGIRVFLEREFDVNARKLDQADWLIESKRQFFEGQNSLIQTVLEKIKNR